MIRLDQSFNTNICNNVWSIELICVSLHIERNKLKQHNIMTKLTLGTLVHEFRIERCKFGNRYYQVFDCEVVNEFASLSQMSDAITSLQKRGFSVSFE